MFRDENFYTFFIKKLFTLFVTLYIGQHKDHHAQLATSFVCINIPLLSSLEFLLWRSETSSRR